MEIIQFSRLINNITDSELNSDKTRLKIKGKNFDVTLSDSENFLSFSLKFNHMEVNLFKEVIEFYNSKGSIPFLEIELEEVIEVGFEDENTILLKFIGMEDILITITEDKGVE